PGGVPPGVGARGPRRRIGPADAGRGRAAHGAARDGGAVDTRPCNNARVPGAAPAPRCAEPDRLVHLLESDAAGDRARAVRPLERGWARDDALPGSRGVRAPGLAAG